MITQDGEAITQADRAMPAQLTSVGGDPGRVCRPATDKMRGEPNSDFIPREQRRADKRASRAKKRSKTNS